MTSFKRDFLVAQIGQGTVAHYIDYRRQHKYSVCGVQLTETDKVVEKLDIALCGRCANSRYPTEAEWREYNQCTDCGINVAEIGETAYHIRNRVWDIAYPGYSSGVGVGFSRPCIGCLEERLERTLTYEDFDMNWGANPRFSERLNNRLTKP